MRLPIWVILFFLVFITPQIITASPKNASIPDSLMTPDRVETNVGVFEFKNGIPSRHTVDKAYDQIDFTHAYNTFVNTYAGVSIRAAHKGLQGAGLKDNEVMIFSKLMDSKSLFLTANADTIYAMGVLDLTKGPMVVETPPKFLGLVDDYWFRWVTDMGVPGTDRGNGGKYVIVPPGFEGALPEGGFTIAHARTNRVLWFGRSFLENKSDPKPAVDSIRKNLKVYPYQAGGLGTPIVQFLEGKAPLTQVAKPPTPVFHEGSGKVMNTVPPSDWTFFEYLNEIVQQEPAGTLDPELMGSIAAIGIVKGKKFAPDARMKKL